jgi:hypothetical protein
MDVTINIPQELESELTQRAMRKGQDAKAYISQIITNHLRKSVLEDSLNQTANFAEDEEPRTQEEAKQPLKSSLGLCADLNISISKEEIDEARREMWANFPRERFFETEERQ